MAIAPQKMTEVDLVAPLLNVKGKLAKKIPLSLADNVSLREIRADDLALITRLDIEGSSHIRGGVLAFTFEGIPSTTSANDLDRLILAAAFSASVLGEGSICLDEIYAIRLPRKVKLEAIHRFRGLAHGTENAFEIKRSTDVGSAEILYSSTYNALTAHDPLRLTLSRFCSSLGKSTDEHRLIDLCISLESIFQAQTEISFQFSLYNSLLAEAEVARREIVFDLLKKLYEQRSKIVHGVGGIDTVWLAQHWPDLVRIAKAAIIKKIEFLNQHNKNQWKTYLRSLALGSDNG
ncbi:MAG: hypothetical protein AB7F98_06505 [Novosphingobium sp.]